MYTKKALKLMRTHYTSIGINKLDGEIIKLKRPNQQKHKTKPNIQPC